MACWPPLPCPGCGRRPANQRGACAACWRAIDGEPHPEGPWLVAWGAYRGPLGRLVRAAKYRPSTALLRALGARLGAHAGERWPDFCRTACVVPVPPDADRQRRRGVDHTALLAAAVAAALPHPRPTCPALRRNRTTRPQSLLPAAHREANLQGAFDLRWPQGERLAARVLLVDDVCTSGATLRSCRAALQAGGATEVRAAVVARAR
jgi:ComF family protein